MPSSEEELETIEQVDFDFPFLESIIGVWNPDLESCRKGNDGRSLVTPFHLRESVEAAHVNPPSGLPVLSLRLQISMKTQNANGRYY